MIRQWFSLVTSSPVKIIAESPYPCQKVVIHANPYIILYFVDHVTLSKTLDTIRSNSNAIFTRAAVMVYAAKLPSCAGSCLFCISGWLIEILANYSDPYANIPSLGMGEMHDFMIGTWFTVGDMGKIDNNRKITTKHNLVSWDFHHIWRTTCYQSNMYSHICIYIYIYIYLRRSR